MDCGDGGAHMFKLLQKNTGVAHVQIVTKNTGGGVCGTYFLCDGSAAKGWRRRGGGGELMMMMMLMRMSNT